MILGLVLSKASPEHVKAALNSRGVHTNKIHGIWSGVSYARWERLVELVCGVASTMRLEECEAGMPLLLRFLWEKATSKQDLLDFLLSLHQNAPLLGVLDAEFARDKGRQSAWVEEAFGPDEIEDEGVLEQAALSVLHKSISDADFALNFERLGAGMSAVHASRAAVRVERHTYKGGKEVPDCVEVVLREVIEMLIYDRCVYERERARAHACVCL